MSKVLWLSFAESTGDLTIDSKTLLTVTTMNFRNYSRGGPVTPAEGRVHQMSMTDLPPWNCGHARAGAPFCYGSLTLREELQPVTYRTVVIAKALEQAPGTMLGSKLDV